MTQRKTTPKPKPTAPAKPTDFPLAVLLRHTGKLLEDRARSRLDGLGLHLSQGQVLRALHHRDGVGQVELTRTMLLSAPTISGILKRMEDQGLIERRADPEDGRAIHVYLTRRGKAKGRAVWSSVQDLESELTANLSPSQLRSAHTLLRKLRDNLSGRAPLLEPPVRQLVP